MSLGCIFISMSVEFCGLLPRCFVSSSKSHDTLYLVYVYTFS